MNDLPLGKILGEPSSVYHGADAVSSTRLRVFRRRARLYYDIYIAKTVPRRTSGAFDFGIAMHYRMEGKARYRKHVVVSPFDDFTTKAAREWRDTRKARGLSVIDAADSAKIEYMVEGIKRNPTAMALLRHNEREVTFRTKVGDYLLQARCDRLNSDGCKLPSGERVGPYMIDIKTLPSLDEGEFASHVANFGYDWQQEYYLQLVKMVTGVDHNFYFLATEKEPPFDCQLFQLDQETRDIAKAQVLDSLRQLHACYQSGVFPGTSTTITPVGLPFWKKKEAVAQLENSRARLT